MTHNPISIHVLQVSILVNNLHLCTSGHCSVSHSSFKNCFTSNRLHGHHNSTHKCSVWDLNSDQCRTLFEPFLCSFDFMLLVIVLLKTNLLPLGVLQTPSGFPPGLLCILQHSFYPHKPSRACCREAYMPPSVMLPPSRFTVGMICFCWCSVLSLRQRWRFF